MTEKTDIAALLDIRDLAERIKAAMASCVGSFCMEVADSIENEIGRGLTEQEHQQISETASGLLVAQDQLEAESQQREAAEAELAELRGEILSAKQEINWPIAQKVRAALDRVACPDAFMRIAVEACTDALRGEQEHGDTTVYMMPNLFASLVNTARDVALEYKNAQCLRDALSRELKGYFTLTRQPKPVVVLPEGWKLVPIEPTEDMVISGFESKPSQSFSPAIEWEAYDAMSGCQQAAYRAKLCWDAMLRAAPKPEV